MATKPTDRILDWASGGTTADPGGTKEAAGWLVSERPPANWWNWILNSFGQWLTWSETSIDAVETAIEGIGGLSKVLGNVKTTSGSTTGSTEGDDVNIASVTSSNDSSGWVTVTFTTAMADTNYVVVTAPGISLDFHDFVVVTKNVGSCKIVAMDHATDAAVVLSVDSVRFAIDIKGN